MIDPSYSDLASVWCNINFVLPYQRVIVMILPGEPWQYHLPSNGLIILCYLNDLFPIRIALSHWITNAGHRVMFLYIC